MEYAKKTLFGYKPVKSGENSYDSDYVVMDVEEYGGLENQLSLEKKRYDELEHSVRNITRKALDATDKQITNLRQKLYEQWKLQKSKEAELTVAKEDLTRKDESIKVLTIRLEEADNKLKGAEKLLESLKRISRERANAARGITPKKEHDGYIILDSRQYNENYIAVFPEPGYEDLDWEWLERQGRLVTERRTAKVWKSVLQTPYDSGLTYDVIHAIIEEELIQKGVLRDIGCDKMVETAENGNYTSIKDESCEQHQNCLYRWEFHANFRTGFWEMEVYTTKAITIVTNRIMKGNK